MRIQGSAYYFTETIFAMQYFTRMETAVPPKVQTSLLKVQLQAAGLWEDENLCQMYINYVSKQFFACCSADFVLSKIS